MPRIAPTVAYDFVEDTIPEPENPFTIVVRALAGSAVAKDARTFKPLDPETGETIKKATIANQLSKAAEIVGDIKVRASWRNYPNTVTIWVVPLEEEEDDEEDDEA